MCVLIDECWQACYLYVYISIVRVCVYIYICIYIYIYIYIERERERERERTCVDVVGISSPLSPWGSNSGGQG